MKSDRKDFASFQRAALASAGVRLKPDKRGFVNLSSNEFVHRRVAEIVALALRGLRPEHATTYPYWPAFEAQIAQRFELDPSQVLLSAGSDAAYRMVLAALDHPSGGIVTQAPNYEQLGLYAQGSGLAVREVRYRPDKGFVLDDFLVALKCAPSTVWISNPNAPSGWLMSFADVATLACACAEGGHLLVIDEAYADFADISHLSLLARQENVVVIRSFSKGWALAGGRLAMVATSPSLAAYLKRWNAANPISGMTLHLASQLFEYEDEFISARRELNAERDWLASAAVHELPGLRPLPSAANFVNLDTGSQLAAEGLASALRSQGVLVREMDSGSLLPRCIRITAAQRDILASVLTVAAEAWSKSSSEWRDDGS